MTALALSLSLAHPALAADKKKAAADTVAPPPALTVPPEAPAAMRDIAGALVGRWKGAGTLVAEGATAPVTLTWTCALAAGGYAVSCVVDGEAEGMGPLAESDLFGVDPTTGLFHWYSVTNTGEVHDHWGSCDGETTTFQYQGLAHEAVYVEKVVFRDVTEAGMKLEAITTESGRETVRLTLALTRG